MRILRDGVTVTTVPSWERLDSLLFNITVSNSGYHRSKKIVAYWNKLEDSYQDGEWSGNSEKIQPSVTKTEGNALFKYLKGWHVQEEAASDQMPQETSGLYELSASGKGCHM